jgi:hypothetical protein
MPDQICGFPRSNFPAGPSSFLHPDRLLRAVARAGRKLCGLSALALLAWLGAASAWAQSSAPPAGDVATRAGTASARPVEPAPATAVIAEPAKPLFEADPWDAPEPWRTDRFYFQFAYYTIHFHYDPDHQQSYLFDAEYHFKETWLGGQWIAGMALFQNSFGQFSQYLFGGLVWRPIEEHQPFYVKLTAGPLHGYSGEYQDKVPLNSSGVAPAIIPGIGYCVQRRYCGEFVLLGTNAALLTIGMTVP